MRRRAGEPWERALAAVERLTAPVPGRAPLDGARQAQWERTVESARAILGEVDVTGNPTRAELHHRRTGMLVTLSQDSAAISVPHAHNGGDALDLMQQVYALARVIQTETDLQGYDQQLDEPVTDAPVRLDGTTTYAVRPRDSDDDAFRSPGSSAAWSTSSPR